jgi:hypothetical protein
MPDQALKVGDLARRTGLAVRTLYDYDAIGLLRPSGHTESGYRLYTAADIARLQQVLSLWPQVRKALDDVGYNGWGTIEDGACRLRNSPAASTPTECPVAHRSSDTTMGRAKESSSAW